MTDRELDAKIGALEHQVGGWFVNREGDFWKQAWSQAKEIRSAFREVRYPTRQQKDAAWERFQAVAEKMKAERDRHEAERQDRVEASADIKRRIISLGGGAWPWGEGALIEFLTWVNGAKVAIAAMGMVIKALEATFGIEDTRTPLEKRRDELKECSRHMREAWDYFTEQKGKLVRTDKDECFKALQGIQNEVEKAWAAWKEEADRFHEERRRNYEQREAAFEQRRSQKRALIETAQGLDPDDRDDAEQAKGLQAEWKAVGFAGKDYEDGMWNDFQTALERFWSRRRRASADRLRGALEKLLEHRNWLEESIEHDEQVLGDTRDKRDTAWNDDYRERMAEKAESLESKIDGKKDSLADAERRIAELRGKIKDLEE